MGGIQENTSSGYSTVKIVLERCPLTEKALKDLQNYHHHNQLDLCSVCGSGEELIELKNYAWTPLESQLFKKRILKWTLEVSGGSGGCGAGDGSDDNEMGWSCEGCMAQFEMLGLVQRRIADLEKKEDEIVSQFKKAIADRLGVISEPNLSGAEPEVTTTNFIFDVDEYPLKSTPMMTDAARDEGEDLDLRPVILEEFEVKDALHALLDDDGVDDGPGGYTIGDSGLISDKETMNHSDQGGIVDEDQSGLNKSRRCKVQATKVISAILRKEDDDENDEYSPTIESDTDSDDTNERELETHKGEEHYNWNGGGMSSNPPTPVQNGGKHICKVCGKQVVRLSRHMETHRLDGQTFSCETCHKTFSAKRTLSDHRNCVHLKQLRYKCQKCRKGFFFLFHLKRHLKLRISCTETKKKKLLCPICKDGFTNKSNLAAHTRSAHNGEKRKKCPHPKCRYSNFDKTKLESHFEIHHLQDGNEIGCTICNEKFSSVAEKLAHIKSSHTCKFCNKSFPNMAERDEHQTTDHAGDRPYFCFKCGNRFLRKNALGRHLRTTPCNPNRDEMEKARQVTYKRKKKPSARIKRRR